MVDRGIRPGDVRLVNGVPALVVDRYDGRSWTCCPVKRLSDEITGKVVFVEMSRTESGVDLYDQLTKDWPLNGAGAALPQFSAAIYKDLVGELLFRVFPGQLEKAKVCFRSVFSKSKPPFDQENENSQEDWAIYRKMAAPSMERYQAFEVDTFVLGEDGEPRPETKKERKNRLARRRRAIKKASKNVITK